MENTITSNQLSADKMANYVSNGLSFSTYASLMLKEETEHNRFSAEHEKTPYIALNNTRMQRVEKTFNLIPELENTLSNLNTKLTWLVLTEFWCGDAAQINPALYKIAEASNGKIDIKFLYRDDHEELMDAYLTNGSRSIPKLVCLNQNFEEVFTWGPRPAEAQELVLKTKANPETKDQYAEVLHLWYARNRSEAIQQELILKLKQVN